MKLRVFFLTLLLFTFLSTLAFPWAERVEVENSQSSAQINLGGADNVKISNIHISTSGKVVKGRFDWSKRTTKNPGEIDQIYLAIERKVVGVIYNGIPGKSGVSKTYSFSVNCDIPTPGKTVGLYVVMTPSRNVSEGKAHYELEGGGYRVRIATLKGY